MAWRARVQLNPSTYSVQLTPNTASKILCSDRNATSIDIWYKQILFSLLSIPTHHNIQCQSFSDSLSIDSSNTKYRLMPIHNVLSTRSSNRLLTKAVAPQSMILESITILFNNSGWYERESHDLSGIHHHGNSDLRRILTDYGFTGYPLRKDFPITGSSEPTHNHSTKLIDSNAVHPVQELRPHNTRSPWSFPTQVH
jgi:NADH:ubiquinone oxidoreductase subunit C